MRRIWTNPLFYREVRQSDVDLAIWHLPAEKTFGLYNLYHQLLDKQENFGFDISNTDYIRLVQKVLHIPHLPLAVKLQYVTTSYYRAIKKRVKKFPLLTRFFQ